MSKKDKFSPLAERCRPESLEDFIGQNHVVSNGKIIRSIIERRTAFSLILWGEPGSGKTTLAKIISRYCSMDSYFLSAISAGVADVRKVIQKGKENRENDIQTLLFLDEIHRFNKAQQDAVLGAVESGDIVLIGATTENPSFSVISPLLSRTRVIRLNKLTEVDLQIILESAIEKDFAFQDSSLKFSDGVKDEMVSLAGGAARRLLNILETAWSVSDGTTTTEENLEEAVKNSVLYYDRAGDKH